MTLPHAHCITLKETPERTKRLTDHLEAEGINYTLFEGINAPAMGLTTTIPYEKDNPGSNFIIEQRRTGNALSHILLWRSLNEIAWRVEDESFAFLILEDDAKFEEGWRDRLVQGYGGSPRRPRSLMSCPCWKSL